MTKSTAELSHEALILDGASEPHRVALTEGTRLTVGYTRRDPFKETENEDSVALLRYGPDAEVLVVADGAGGLPAGKRASLMAVSTLRDSLRDAFSEEKALRTAILNGIEAANSAVLGLANGSATTMTVITVEGRLARSYQVGDSEAIVVGQRGRIKSQTTAHSPTGFAVEAGFLDEREALHHAERHLVSNFIGTQDMRIDIGATVRLAMRDTILVASDGLMDNLHVDEIVEIVRKGALPDAADSLVKVADQRMLDARDGQPSKPDDLSFILYRDPTK